ncbi:tyrosine-type recombinase/integrase, partial [Streptomyces sp. NPDC053431]|uniref:tyrosine-type recombinase/integrase n=1 Tax=Streptomyces sp. NPDC053431 TaxID=3365703 RepID=UPI0037D4303A
MGVGFSYGEMEPADIELMMQTAYLVLRDTGRRPIEIASLRLKCLETRADENTLIWDNVKKRRFGRKLPITRETAAVIKTWQARRRRLEVPSRSRKYLFPSITDRSGIAHMGSSLANAMREWVAAIPVLLSDELDEHGSRMPFDRTLIFRFRYAYAQRHADAGVPVDEDQHSGRKVSTASEQTDLLLARQEIKQLRTENGQLRQQARIHLGEQVEQLGNHDLVDRVNDLTEENLRLSTAERQATTENTQLRQRVTELED